MKVKVRPEGRFAVIGLDAGDGAASLLLAGRRGPELAYVGRVKWGVTRGCVETILARAVARTSPPCPDVERTRGVVWLEPRLTVEVTYSELMLGRLRDPVLRGFVAGPHGATTLR